MIQTAYGPGRTLYSTVEKGPCWSLSLALAACNALVPGAVTSANLNLYGTPIHSGALSLASVTLIDTGITKPYFNKKTRILKRV